MVRERWRDKWRNSEQRRYLACALWTAIQMGKGAKKWLLKFYFFLFDLDGRGKLLFLQQAPSVCAVAEWVARGLDLALRT